MATVYTAADVQFQRDMAAMGRDIRGLTHTQVKPVLAKTINTLGAKARTAALRGVAQELKIRKKDIENRIPKRFRRAREDHLRVVLVGLMQPVPIIRLLEGKAAVRKTYSTRKTRAGNYVQRKGFGPGRGGIKVGKLYFPDAYVAAVKTNATVQVLRRKQRATWVTPWKKRPKRGLRTLGRRPRHGDTYNKRMPVEVLKLNLEKAFDRRFNPEIEKVLERDWQKDFDNAFKFYEPRGFTNRRLPRG